MPDFNDPIKSENDFDEFYRAVPDDEEFFSKLLRDNWSLTGPADIDSCPLIYHDSGQTPTRDNTLGGSIYVYSVSVTFPQIMGIDYDSQKQVGAISIDIQNPQWRKRNRMWTREVIRILRSFRRAGRNQLNGWDYLEIQNVNKRDQNYVGFYHTVIDIKLYRIISDIEDNGRGIL